MNLCTHCHHDLCTMWSVCSLRYTLLLSIGLVGFYNALMVVETMFLFQNLHHLGALMALFYHPAGFLSHLFASFLDENINLSTKSSTVAVGEDFLVSFVVF